MFRNKAKYIWAFVVCMALLCACLCTAQAADLAITRQPEGILVREGESLTISLEARGDGLSYEWYFKDATASKFTKTTSFTGNSYTTKMTHARKGREVYCVVTDQYGNSVQSDTAVMLMNERVEITKQPSEAYAKEGSTAKTTIRYEGTAVSFAWYYKNWGEGEMTLAEGQTTDTYSVVMTPETDLQYVYCLITDVYGNRTHSAGAYMRLADAPVIDIQPEDVYVRTGETAFVQLYAYGTGELTYTWYFKNKGASAFSKTTSFTDNTYSVKMDAARDGRQVYCVVSDAYGQSVKTNTVTLQVRNPLYLYPFPYNVTVPEGQTASVTVDATGDGLTYEWYYRNAGKTDFVKTTSFKGATYAITMDKTRDGREVYCCVTDKWGQSYCTSVATLEMAKPVYLGWQPTDAYAEVGKAATVFCDAQGDGLTYVWYFKNKGASSFSKTSSFTGSTYTVAMDESRNGRQVYCVVTDKWGNTVKMDPVTLHLDDHLYIRQQPKSVTVASGKAAKVTVDANGLGLTYTWYFKNKNASSFSKTSSFTGNTYSLSMDQSRSGRQVYCVIKDKYGNSVQTDTVTLLMKGDMAITTQPRNITVDSGKTAKVTVGAAGEGLTYTWYYKNAGSTAFSKTTSFKGSTYSIDMSSARAGRQVYCVVTDKNGNTATTDTVTLGMVPAGLEYGYSWDVTNDCQVVEIRSYTGSATKLTVPDNIGGIPVRKISAGAFQNCTKLTGITVPSSVKDIGAYAFSGCTKLTKVNIPSGVKTIASGLFSGCTSLKSLSLPASITAIDNYAFENCTGFTTFKLPAKLKTLGNYAFKDCTNIASVSLPSGLTSLGGGAFYNCKKLASVTVPSGVTAIQECTFEDCTALKTVVLPDGVTALKQSAFAGCSALSSITLGSGLKTVALYAFSDCSSLQSIALPSTVTTIGDYAFMSCSAMTTATVGSSVKTVGNYAFWDCSSLKSIKFPSTLTSLGEYAFWNCSALTSATLGKITRIGDYTFADCVKLKSVTIPSTVTSLGDSAFNGCAALTAITVPGSVTALDEWTFAGCTSLQSVSLPDTVTKIGPYAFAWCSSLTSVTIPASATTIGERAFLDCTALATVTMNSKLKTLGTYAFDNCTALTAVKLPSTVTSIGTYAFSNCGNLVSANIPSKMTKVPDGLFFNCESLKSITIPSSVTSIGADAFSACTALTKVTVPASVTSIGNDAFYSCSALTEVTLGSNLKTIGSGAFRFCWRVKTMQLPATVTTIGSEAFFNCAAMTSITLPGSITKIGANCFAQCSSLKATVTKNSYAHTWCKNNGVRYAVK